MSGVRRTTSAAENQDKRKNESEKSRSRQRKENQGTEAIPPEKV